MNRDTNDILKANFILIEFMKAELNGEIDVLKERSYIEESIRIQHKTNLITNEHFELIKYVLTNYEELKKEKMELIRH